MLSKITKTKTLAAIGLASLLTLSWGFSQRVLAQTPSQDNPREGLPGRRIGGGTRGDCKLSSDITALVPEKNPVLTVAGYPTFFFYMPQNPTPLSVEFVLRDENDEKVYEKTLMTSGNSGIMAISLPASKAVTPLVPDKNYHWYFSIICNPQKRDDDIFVEGFIKRVVPNEVLASKLEHASPEDRAAIYADNGIWQEALLTLAQLHRSNPQDLTIANNWNKLLQSVGLDTIAQEPIVTVSQK